MTRAEIIHHRMLNQHLVGSGVRTPEEIVAGLGAMQAQEYAMVKWAVALRVPDSTDALIESAVSSGRILRTHVLRPTWHLVTPADIRWMLALTAPRVRVVMAYMDRQLEVDGKLLKRVHRTLVKALEGGRQLSRVAMQATLARAKIDASGPRLAHILIHAELDGLICSGAREAGHFTYALLEERVPPTQPKDRNDALVELARRYFSARGPATAQDFAWWSGLTVADAKKGMAQLREGFVREAINGIDHLFPTRTHNRPQRMNRAFLLPDYDELVIGYKDRAAFFASAAPSRVTEYNRSVLVDGSIAGSWRPQKLRDGAAIEIATFSAADSKSQRAITSAAEAFGSFLGRKVELTFRVQRAK